MVMVSMFYLVVVIVITNLNVPRLGIFGAQTLEMFSGGRNKLARKHSAVGVSKFSNVQLFQQLQMYKRAGVQL